MARIALALRLLPLAAAATLAACATAERVPDGARAPGATAPATAPAVDLAGARRCMDTLLQDQGPRDLALLVEDGADRSGGRELIVSAISDMTQRSRAVRLVQAGKATQGDAPALAVRAAFAEAGKGTVAMDVALLSVRDQSVVPGTASRTSAAVSANGAEIRKSGVVLGVALQGADTRAQAQRAVADVAAIELLGRAARVPYWRCVGASAADPSVTAEVQDWYDGMAARPSELIAWFQQQLKARRAYDGAVDGAVNPALKDAVARYRELLGLSREPKLSLDLFQAWLAADHHALAGKLNPPAVATATPVAPPALPAATPLPAALTAAAPALQLRIAPNNASQRFAKGESVQLTIQPSRDAHVYCFHQDEQRRITRFFPNRFRTDSLVPAAGGMQLPGSMRFEIVMNDKGVPESVACFATERDVQARLPANLTAGDFAPLPVATLDQVRSAFAKAAEGSLASDSFQLRGR